jgi:hypothetical protein
MANDLGKWLGGGDCRTGSWQPALRQGLLIIVARDRAVDLGMRWAECVSPARPSTLNSQLPNSPIYQPPTLNPQSPKSQNPISQPLRSPNPQPPRPLSPTTNPQTPTTSNIQLLSPSQTSSPQNLNPQPEPQTRQPSIPKVRSRMKVPLTTPLDELIRIHVDISLMVWSGWTGWMRMRKCGRRWGLGWAGWVGREWSWRPSEVAWHRQNPQPAAHHPPKPDDLLRPADLL